MSPTQPVVAVLLTDATRTMVLDAAAERELGDVADLRFAAGPPAAWNLPTLLDGAVACLTGWGTPPLSAAVIDGAADLRLVAHTAGSVRRLLPAEMIDRRVVVCQAAELIADSVAEMVILQILSQLRELHRFDAGLRAGEDWHRLRERHPGRLLGSRTVGVVGASRTGRAVIGLLRAFSSTVLVCDPTLGSDEAGRLGVQPVDLDRLLTDSAVVTLHAPLLPETKGMIGARELALMADGALLVNSARGDLVDADALLAELRAGRLRASLDVFDTEPLPADSPWRRIDRALVSPHAAGHTLDSHLRQGAAMAAEVIRHLRGEPLRYRVAAESAALLA